MNLRRQPEKLFEECSKLSSRFQSLTFPLETQLRLLVDRQLVKASTDDVDKIKKLASSLGQLSEGEKSAVLLLAKGYLALLEGKYTSARDSLQQCVSKMKKLFSAQFFLAQALFTLHDNVHCVQVCEEALSLLSSKSCVVSVSTDEATQHLLLLAARCCLLLGSKLSLTQALGFLEKLTENTVETDIVHAYVYLELGEEEQLQACLQKLSDSSTTEVKALKACVDFHNKKCTDAVTKLQQCVSEDGTNAEYMLKLGRVLWEQR
ncbi:uncharacterized protein [Littorina saxatilis]|uniref:uncharacterized protein n=1 Tax=Littorina saxatilis TaxID=31220 RepID=UPI0038B59009